MAEAFPVGYSARRPSPPARTVPSVRPFLLPSIGFVTFAVGVALLLDRSPTVGGYTPLALLAIGTGALIASVVVDGKRPASRPSSPRGASPSGVPVSSDRYLGAEEATHFSAVDEPSSLTSGSEWRVLAAPTDPGDETWLSWLPRESRRLGAVWTATAPRERYSPGTSGHLVAFPVGPTSAPPRPAARTSDAGESESSPTRGRFTDEELDRMFPPVGRTTSVFLSAAPDRVGRTRPVAEPMHFSRGPDSGSSRDVESHEPPALEAEEAEPPATGSAPDDPFAAGETPIDSAPPLSDVEFEPILVPRRFDPQLALEACNPLPPHLRSSALHFPASPDRRRARLPDLTTQKSVCASCSKVVANLRLSGPCPKCLRPVCDACLREAFVTRGHGWCVDCSASHEMITAETAA